MRDMRILFMGTPDFAVAVLKRLLEDKWSVVGVITAPDKPAGRGRKIHQSPVKTYAIDQNIAVLQPKNLKDEKFIDELKHLNATLQIVVAFRMLPKIVWAMPVYGTVNLHASLLPSYRGAAPIHWAIINGEEKTGVTTFFIDEKIDTGKIILQREVKIEKHETVGELHNRLMNLGADLVSETVTKIKKNAFTTQPQPKAVLKLAPKLFAVNCRIDWNASLDDIYNFIRGLNPFPAAWSEMQNRDTTISIKIFKVRKEEQVHNIPCRSIIFTKKEVKVAVKNGYIHIDELKISGKKKLDTKSFLNGFSFSSKARMI